MKKARLLTLLLSLCSLTYAQTDSTYNLKLLVGTYTSGKSEGIYVYNFSSKAGKSSKISSTNSANPSYLAISANNKFVYAVNELGGEKGNGTVTAFTLNAGKLTELNKQTTGGDHPCYVAIDNTSKWVVAGNYNGGNFAIFPLLADGKVGAFSSLTDHSGSSINKERQEKAHVHCTIFSPDNRYLLVADLGTDEVTIYPFNQLTGVVSKPYVTKVEPGSGPRHLVFHPNGKYVYLTEEMFGNVAAYKFKKGKLKKLQTISMVQPKFIGQLGAADIHISSDGRFLYSSNRGESDRITIFSINRKGSLKVQGYQSVLGFTPRNFTIDPTGNYLLVANQNSDAVVVFKRDKVTGLLTDTNERIRIPNPVCLKWLN